LLGYRTAESLRWHFSAPEDGKVVKMLCSRRGGRLAGYAVVAQERATQAGLVRSRILDVFVERDDNEIISELFSAAYDLAQREGSHVLELCGFPKEIREVFVSLNPYSRQLPSCPYFYKVFEGGIQMDLADESLWYASPFDGDASL
jgi:hypothetical protein